MRKTKRRKILAFSLIMGFLIMVGVASCKDDNPVSQEDGTTIHVNTPPDTWLNTSIVEQDEYSFRMQFVWGGSDTSGEIDRFQWVMKFYYPDDVIEIKNWEWLDIYCTDTTMVFMGDVMTGSYPTFKFFIRAVDGENLPDRTPESTIIDVAEILNN